MKRHFKTLFAFSLILQSHLLMALPTEWTESGTGSWNNPLNWSAGVPAGNDANILNGGDPVLDISPSPTPGSVAILTLDNNHSILTVRLGATMNVAQTSLISGTINVTGFGTTWNNTSSIAIGLDKGTFNLRNGAQLTTNMTIIGNGGIGIARVEGVGTSWSSSAGTIVNNGGVKGTLNIIEGGSYNEATSIDVGKGGAGFLNVEGTGSILTASSLKISLNNGIGEATISSNGQVTIVGATTLTNNVDGTATLNLNGPIGSGGRLTTQSLTGGPGTKIVNFDGGILQANATNANFITGISSINVLDEGAFIDSNGHDIGANSAFIGVGSITKVGIGRLTLGGNLNNLGGLVVDEGTVLTTATVDGPVSVNNSGTLIANAALNNSLTINDEGTAFILQTSSVAGPTVVNDNGTLITTGNLNGSLTLNNVGSFAIINSSSTVAGPAVVNDGTLILAGTLSNSATVNGGLLNVLDSEGVINGSTVVNDNGALVASGKLNGSLTLNDTATATVNNTVSGSTILNDASFLNANGALNGSLTLNDSASATVDTVNGPTVLNGDSALIANGALNATLTLNDSASATVNTVSGPTVLNGDSALIANGALVDSLTLNDSATAIVNNTVSGPTVVNGGILTNNGNLLNTATVNGGGIVVNVGASINGLSTINNNGTMALYGTLYNNLILNDDAQAAVFSGGLVKGIATLNDNAQLLVNGQVTGLVVTKTKSYLSGNGIIGALDNSGTVSPGQNSIGTLTIIGDYVNRTTGIYQTQIDPAGQSDLLAVGGTATLQGGTLDLIAAPGNYLSGTTYTLITAAGGLSGQFATVTDNLPISYILKYFPNSLVLELGNAINRHGLSGNSRRVANYINSFPTIFTGEFLTVLTALQSLNSDGLFDALEQLHPAPFQALTINAGDAAHLVNDSFMDRLNLLRTTQCEPCYSCSSGGAWISGLAGYMNQDRVQGLRGFNGTNGGISIGYDKCLYDSVYAGIGAGYSNSYIKWNKSFGHSEGDNYYLGVYATQFSDDYYADASLLGFWGDYKSNRHIEFADIDRRAKSKQDNWGINPHFASGLILDYCGIDVIPYGEFDYYYISQDKFHEHGADTLNLHVKSHNGSILRLETGLRFAKAHDCCGYGQFLPYASISYVGNRYYGRKFKSSFNDQPNSFAVFGTDRCFNQAEFGIGFAYLINDNFAINTSYEIAKGSKRQDQEFNFELNYKF